MQMINGIRSRIHRCNKWEPFECANAINRKWERDQLHDCIDVIRLRITARSHLLTEKHITFVLLLLASQTSLHSCKQTVILFVFIETTRSLNGIFLFSHFPQCHGPFKKILSFEQEHG